MIIKIIINKHTGLIMFQYIFSLCLCEVCVISSNEDICIDISMLQFVFGHPFILGCMPQIEEGNQYPQW